MAHHGRPAGKAIPHRIGRHVHPKAATDPAPAPIPTGIDYLRLVEDRHARLLGQRLHYAQLADPAQPPVASRAADTGIEDPPPDRDRLTYSAELLTLAGMGPTTGPRRPRCPSAPTAPPPIPRRPGEPGQAQLVLRFHRHPVPPQPLPAMPHRHGGHAEAVARIRWCVTETALGVITGEVRAGKTVAPRAELDAARHTVIYPPNPAVGTCGLYPALVTGLGGVPRYHTAALITQTMDHLAAQKHERGRAVVAIHEAHLLSADQLEELRLLTKSEMDSVAPFTGLLLGQPTLRRRIKLGAFAALDQRIALRYALPGMTEPETRDYLTHHLKLAGRTDQLFSDDDDAALIHQTGRGLPRAINNLGLQALLATYAANKTIVDESTAHAAITEVTAA